MATTSLDSLPAKEKKDIKKRLSEIARSLKTRRIELGISQDQLAERAGTTVEIVRKIENGTKYPSLIMLLRIERALETKIL